ncbi:TRAP transporter substrate-binding protein [Jiella sonneratiae]|uniref:TRAP transporter substrate-binding protein n=1 Tax=Jiella sonneratiae TaxID=2816856 RepID=A0ABS3J8Q2_9HYPH|nr:TRAP transporter substrate-binding protein [Jiella sonneratiae]MBO0906046.1 TRAP transporter substrate-binding protein [Jiella sonneratiae]
MTLLTKMAAAALALSLTAGVARAEELKFANFMPPTNPYEKGAFQPFAQKLKDATDGKVTVEVFSGGELGAGPVEQYSRAVDGVADFVVSLPGYTASNFPITLLAELPGVIHEDTGTKTMWDNIDLFQPEYRRVHLVSLWSNAENVLYSRDKPIRTPDDVKGMKIRVPSRNTGLLVESWGATPVSMPVSEIYNSLQTGVIDAAMIDGTGTKAFKLGEVSKYVTVGMNTTISPFFILMNRDSYQSLDEAEQKAVDAVGKEISFMANETQLGAAHKGIDAFGEMPDHEVIHLTDEEKKAFDDLSKNVTDKVVAEAEQNGLPAKKVVGALSSN